MREIAKVFKIGSSLAICIPKSIAERLNLSVGDFVEIQLEDGELSIRKI